MARNSLIGLYLFSGKTTHFCYGVFNKDKSLNFLVESSLYKSPALPDLLISPKTMVIWND